MIRIENYKFTDREIESVYWEHKCFVTYSKVYEIAFSPHKGFYPNPIAKKKFGCVGFTERGNEYFADRDDVNDIVRTNGRIM